MQRARPRLGSSFSLLGVALPTRTPIRDRYSFANIDEALTLPDLISVQRDSFEWFLKEGLKATFRYISPIKDFTETLQLEPEFEPSDANQLGIAWRGDKGREEDE